MTSTLDKFRPVVAFDVDGVLRVRENAEQDLIPLSITMKKDEYPTLFHGRPRWDKTGEATGVNYFSRAGVELLRRISTDDAFDACWATTWQHWANRYFGEPFGVPELPAAVKTLYPEGQNWYHCSHSWKTSQLRTQFDGRPLIWLDDSLPDRPGEALAELRRPLDRALTLHYAVDSWTGLTEDDVKIIEEWLELASTEEGHRELRTRHRKSQAEKRAQAKSWERDRLRRHKHFDIVKARSLSIFPQNDRLARELASMSQHREGLTPENVGYALKRCGVVADAEEVSAQLRIFGYHKRYSRPPEEDNDGDYDF